jgi:hypothetical protein
MLGKAAPGENGDILSPLPRRLLLFSRAGRKMFSRAGRKMFSRAGRASGVSALAKQTRLRRYRGLRG